MAPRGVVVVEDDGGHIPALEHVANRPIAEHVLEELASAGVEEAVIASSRDRAGQIRDALSTRRLRTDMRLRYVEHPGRLDLPRALRLAAPIIGDAPCVVHLANGLLGEPLVGLAERLQSDSPDVVVIAHQQPTVDEHLNRATQAMLHIAEFNRDRAALGLAGVWLCGAGALQRVHRASWRHRAEVDLTDVAAQIEAAGGSLQVVLVVSWHKYSGKPLDLLDLNQVTLDRLEADARAPGCYGNQIEGRVRIADTASVRDSLIVGPTVIGPGAVIADAYIGPYTSIGPNVRVEGAEIERSIIGAGASISHVGARLVASVVGSDARIFRDFSLPRALRLVVGEGTEVALC